MTETTYIRKGDIFYVELGTERNGSVQNGGATGVRPCVVMANKVACEVSPVLLVVPLLPPVLESTAKECRHILNSAIYYQRNQLHYLSKS